jgi:hypothetical protein
VLVTDLCAGQRASVLQLPVQAHSPSEAETQAPVAHEKLVRDRASPHRALQGMSFE